MKSITQISIASLILVKIILGSVLIWSMEFDNIIFENEAVASETENVLTETLVSSKIEPHKKTQEETIDLEFLIRKKAELNAQERQISSKKEKLLEIQKDINQKLEELRKIRDEINTQMAEKEAMADGKIKHLIKIYSTMKPQRAASLIEKLDLHFSINLLSMMKGEEVGNILSFVDLEKAAKISEGLAKTR